MKKPKKPKKPTKSKLTNRLDVLWSHIIKKVGKCERCGRTYNLQAAHIHSRSNRSTRWILLNGLCLCGGCHLFWAHQHPTDFTDFVMNKLGFDVYDELRTLAHTAKHYTVDNMLEIESQLKQVANG